MMPAVSCIMLLHIIVHPFVELTLRTVQSEDGFCGRYELAIAA